MKSKCEAFIKIRSQSRQNMKSGVKPSFFREKMKPSSKYEVKVWSLHQNTKPNKPSSRYEVRCKAFIFQRKKWNLHRNTKSKCEAFLEIQSQRNLHQDMKPKKPSSKYEVRCKAFIFQRIKETFLKIQSQSVKPSSKYEAKETFVKIWS
jgi:hypothetical protein